MKVPLAVASAVVAILGIGYAFGASTKDERVRRVAPGPYPSAGQTPVASEAPHPVPVVPVPVAEPLAAPDVFPLARANPITGPGRPPLPHDEHGPHGSRRTTGTYEVALTFDDGPDPRWTPEVLNALREHRVKATFCVIGVMAEQFPHLIRDIADGGHTLCNHTWAHDTGLGKRGYATIVDDMRRTNDAIRAAAPGTRVSYFRQPGGAWTDAAVAAARSMGMTSLHWTVDPKDWLRPGARAIAAEVNQSTIPGAIVLLHDGGGDRRGTTEALRSILPSLAARLPLVALPPGVDPPKRHGFDLPMHIGQQ